MMTPDPILDKFRSAVALVYGARIERVVRYGSRARGDAKPDSDYDIVVFINDLSSRWQEFRRLADIEIDLLDETGAAAMNTPADARDAITMAENFVASSRAL